MSFRIASSSNDSAAIKRYAKEPIYNANEIHTIPINLDNLEENSILVNPVGKQPCYDNYFFKEGIDLMISCYN